MFFFFVLFITWKYYQVAMAMFIRTKAFSLSLSLSVFSFLSFLSLCFSLPLSPSPSLYSLPISISFSFFSLSPLFLFCLHPLPYQQSTAVFLVFSCIMLQTLTCKTIFFSHFRFVVKILKLEPMPRWNLSLSREEKISR